MPQKGVLTNSVTRKFLAISGTRGSFFGNFEKGLRSGLTRKLRFLLSVGDQPYSEENKIQGNRRTPKILKANGIIYMKRSVKAFCVTFAKFFCTVCICTD